MGILNELSKNNALIVAIIAWFSSQVIKTICNFIRTKEFNVERLFGAGGMPSSHSCTVCALSVYIARSEGLASPIFAITFILTCIVMYDAMGVRRAAGEQAKIINFFVQKHNNEKLENDKIQQESIDKNLKEFLGHTPIEVISGSVLGCFISAIYPL